MKYVVLTLALSFPVIALNAAERRFVSEPEITVLSTMLASFVGEGEWGFSALIETAHGTLLFDTGFRQTTVWRNAQALGVDLSRVHDVILTHYHTDHTGGLLLMRRTLMDEYPDAFARVYVGRGFFQQRYDISGRPIYSLNAAMNPEYFETPAAFRRAAEALGIEFTVVDEPTELLPGVFITGPIERRHDERNVSPGRFLDRGARQPDLIPESQVLGLLTPDGWLMVSGCGHAGIVNASAALRDIELAPVVMGVGGFHLFRASTDVLDWTADALSAVGLESLVGAHCTGAPATYYLKDRMGLRASKVSIGAVGTRITAAREIIRASVE